MCAALSDFPLPTPLPQLPSFSLGQETSNYGPGTTVVHSFYLNYGPVLQWFEEQ